MSVTRISTESLNKIMNGGLKDDEQTTVVVKFYSNNCHLCHALSEYYLNLSDDKSYEDVYFFAHNVDDDGDIPKKLNLNGVPSFALFQTRGGKCTKTRIMADPELPNEKTWFTVKQIKNFINRER